MSTVLKAVQELDRGPGPLASAEPQSGEAYRTTTWVIGLVALALLIAVGVVGRRVFEGTSASRVAVAVPAAGVIARAPVAAAQQPVVPPAVVIARVPAVAAPQPVAPPAVAAQAAAVVPSDVAIRSTTEAAVADVALRSRPDADAPWGRVEIPPAEPSANVEAQPRPRRRPPAEPSVRSAALAPPPAVIEAPAEQAPMGMGVPRVQVRAIVSGSDSSGRRVVLSIAGRPSVTLHEGESSDGVDVQFITARTVYLRHRGNIFSAGMDR